MFFKNGSVAVDGSDFFSNINVVRARGQEFKILFSRRLTCANIVLLEESVIDGSIYLTTP